MITIGRITFVNISGELSVSIPYCPQNLRFNFAVGESGVFFLKRQVAGNKAVTDFSGHLNISAFGYKTIFTAELVILAILANGFKERLPSVDELQALNAISNESLVEVKTAIVSTGTADIIFSQPSGKGFACFIFGVADNSFRVT